MNKICLSSIVVLIQAQDIGDERRRSYCTLVFPHVFCAFFFLRAFPFLRYIHTNQPLSDSTVLASEGSQNFSFYVTIGQFHSSCKDG